MIVQATKSWGRRAAPAQRQHQAESEASALWGRQDPLVVCSPVPVLQATPGLSNNRPRYDHKIVHQLTCKGGGTMFYSCKKYVFNIASLLEGNLLLVLGRCTPLHMMLCLSLRSPLMWHSLLARWCRLYCDCWSLLKWAAHAANKSWTPVHKTCSPCARVVVLACVCHQGKWHFKHTEDRDLNRELQ